MIDQCNSNRDLSKPLIYLASPYTHESYEVRKRRAEEVCRFGYKCIQKGLMVFGPIAHSVKLAETVGAQAAGAYHDNYHKDKIHNMWMDFDVTMIKHCDELWVLKLKGWQESKGVTEEIMLARELDIPVVFIPSTNHDEIIDMLAKQREVPKL